MALDPTPPDAAKEPIADRNVERLLGGAYRPEALDPDFVESVQQCLLTTARKLARDRAAVPPPAGPSPTRRRGSWVWARAYGIAAALVGVALLYHLLNYEPSNRPRRKPRDADSGSKATRNAQGDTPGLIPQPRRDAPPVRRVRVGEEVRTAAKQRLRLGLPDGSVLYVNANTDLRVSGVRRVRLSRGEVFVEVAPRPRGHRGATFEIQTAARSITALGTKFAVRAAGDGTGVLVTQGKVKVSDWPGTLVAGQELTPGSRGPRPARRASHLLDWTRELMAASESPLVPGHRRAGGALVTLDPDGQEVALSLRRFHIDVHIEDGFARTTIDQTYFNHHLWRQEGTFFFPLPPDASLSRLAMYVDGKLREGGMAERRHARRVYETIVSRAYDPALLEWVDGSTFKMRVFPLEPRQEKRIILSYTQKLPGLYGTTRYRFPAGHTFENVGRWSFLARIRHGKGLRCTSTSHPLKRHLDGADLIVESKARDVKPDRDVTLEIRDPRQALPAEAAAQFSTAIQKDNDGKAEARYLMVRYRPVLNGPKKRERRDWVFLFESSGDRDPLLARTQVEVVRKILADAEHEDTFTILTAATRVRLLSRKLQQATPENAKAAVRFLEHTHLVGALNLAQALDGAAPFLKAAKNPYLVQLGSGTAIFGERRMGQLVKRIPVRARYVGVGVGKRWARNFMKTAAERTGGYVTQINPDEPIRWRTFELLATLNLPRLVGVQVHDPAGKVKFLSHDSSLSQGEELCAVARLRGDGKDMPAAVRITGKLDGKPYRHQVKVEGGAPGADYLPRTWAKLEIDRLLAENFATNKDRIIELSKQMYVMSPFTSLLVLENDQMHKQFDIDGGRRDHWAPYDCPREIKVVREPIAPGPRPAKGKNAKGKKPSVAEVLKSILVRTPPRLLSEGNPGQVSPPYLNAYQIVSGAIGVSLPTLVPALDNPGATEEREETPASGSARFNALRRDLLKDFQGTVRLPRYPAGGFPVWGGLLVGFNDQSGGFNGRFNGGFRGFRGLAGIAGFGGFGGIGGIAGVGGGIGGLRRPSGTPPPPSEADGDEGGNSDGNGNGNGDVNEEPVPPSGGMEQPLSPDWENEPPPDETSAPGKLRINPRDLRRQTLERLRLLRQAQGWPGLEAWEYDGGYGAAEGLLSGRGVDARLLQMIRALSGSDWRFAADSPVRSLLYQRPVFSGDVNQFSDPIRFAPGMNTSRADIRAALDAEAAQEKGNLTGTIDPGARVLIDKARRSDWQALTVTNGKGRPAFRVVFDGSGRYAYERFVSENLRERVICNGKNLLHLYPELGVGARRTVSRFHREDLRRLIPWALPPVEDLARGANLKKIAQRTVALIPLSSPGAGKKVHLIFGPNGNLSERRVVAGPSHRVLFRETYHAGRVIRRWQSSGATAKFEYRFGLNRAAAPDLRPDLKGLVVVPMPLRTREKILTAAGLPTDPDPKDLPADVAIALIASDGLTQGAGAVQVFGNRFQDRGDKRVGFYTLQGGKSPSWNHWDLLWPDVPKEPLVKYLVATNPKTDQPEKGLSRLGQLPLVGGQAEGFIQRLREFNNLVRRRGFKVRNGGKDDGQWARDLKLARGFRSPQFRFAALDLLAKTLPWPDARFSRALAEAYRSSEDNPALVSSASYERARHLARAGDMPQARKLFATVFTANLQQEVSLPIDLDAFQAFRQNERGRKEWNYLLRKAAADLTGRRLRPAVIRLAWQCHELGDQESADWLYSWAFAGLPARERKEVTFAALEYFCHTAQFARADELFLHLKDDKELASHAMFWRLGAELASGRQKLGQALVFWEKALDTEYRHLPPVINLQAVRHDYGVLLYQYRRLAIATRMFFKQPPKDLIPKVVRAADRWRSLDSDGTGACLAAARALLALGRRDLAWDYFSTPLSRTPGEYTLLRNLVLGIEAADDEEGYVPLSDDEFALVEMGFTQALAADPTNARILWDRAMFLERTGRMTAARRLLHRLLNGKWPARFDSLRDQARQWLEGRGYGSPRTPPAVQPQIRPDNNLEGEDT
jgi:ferric-dicitrate binding protein FerR (iron transport regulator)